MIVLKLSVLVKSDKLFDNNTTFRRPQKDSFFNMRVIKINYFSFWTEFYNKY